MMNILTPSLIGTSLWQVLGTVLAVVGIAVLLELVLYLVFKLWLNHRFALPLMLITPAAIGLVLLVVYPIVYEFILAFSNMSLSRFRNPSFSLAIGFQNLKWLFTEPVLKQQHFFPVFLRTLLWTLIQITFHTSIGLTLALLLNRPMKLRWLYRTILIIPWALPQVVAALAWRGEYNFEYGFPNVMLTRLGLSAIQWKSNPFWNFVAMNITNIWLGIPFMMIILLGGLQSIDPTFYEAAEMDGAGSFDKLRKITLPLLRPVMVPAIVLGVIWTFNNFNVPYFINEQNLESSDILVTALFRSAFEYNRYGFAAMFAVIIFLILLGITVLYMRISGFSPGSGIMKSAQRNEIVEGKRRAAGRIATGDIGGSKGSVHSEGEKR